MSDLRESGPQYVRRDAVQSYVIGISKPVARHTRHTTLVVAV